MPIREQKVTGYKSHIATLADTKNCTETLKRGRKDLLISFDNLSDSNILIDCYCERFNEKF